jgi:hypothetical protein
MTEERAYQNAGTIRYLLSGGDQYALFLKGKRRVDNGEARTLTPLPPSIY